MGETYIQSPNDYAGGSKGFAIAVTLDGKTYFINPTVKFEQDENGDWVQPIASENVTLQSAATTTGNGTPYTPTKSMALTFEITGTSSSRTIIFEIAGPSGVYVAQQALRVTDNSLASQTTNGTNAAPENWLVSVPLGWSFRARISAIAGGNVSIGGKAVS
jgi:hypothetical protein